MEKVELFKDGKFTREMLNVINTFIRMYQNTLWAISALSDVQELIDRGFLGEACDKINDAKGIIKGQFEVIEDGFAIAR